MFFLGFSDNAIERFDEFYSPEISSFGGQHGLRVEWDRRMVDGQYWSYNNFSFSAQRVFFAARN